MLGKFKLGEALIGAVGDSDIPGIEPIPVIIPEIFGKSPEELSPTSPIVTFYELESSLNNFIRIVDFGVSDVDPSQLVTYKGNQYVPFHIGQPTIEKSLSGKLSNITIPVADPTYLFRNFVLDNNDLREAILRIDIIQYKNKDTPSLGRSFTFFVSGVKFIEEPASVSVDIGPPPALEIGAPSLEFNDILCHNPYSLRFIHNTNKNPCGYPSAEFNSFAQQDYLAHESFLGQTDAEKEHLNGWFSVYRTKIRDWRVHPGVGGLLLHTKEELLTYTDTTKNAPRMYKRIPAIDVNGTFDIQLHVSKLWSTTALTSVKGGLIILDEIPNDEALIWGGFFDSTNGGYFYSRLDNNSVSEIYTIDNTYHSGGIIRGNFRVVRTNLDTIELYSALPYFAPDYQNIVWGLKHTITKQFSPAVRIGVIAFNFGAASIELISERFIFLNGGLPTCDLTLSGPNGCEAHKNTVERNSFVGLPSGVRFV